MPSNISLKHLKVFVTVYKEGNITGAAEKLRLTQPQVSLYMREMETYYGTALFQRNGRGIARTEAAVQLFEYSSHIISMYDEMDTKMKNWNSSGRLRIGSSISIGICLMPAYVKKYNQLHPTVDVTVTIDSSDNIEHMLRESRLDFALIEGTPHSDSFIVEPFMEDELALICNPNNPLAQKSDHLITADDLEEQPLLLREKNSATRNLAEETLTSLGVPVVPIWESTSTTAIVNAVIENLGISILPRRFLAEYIRTGKVIPLKLEGSDFKRSYNIIYHKNKYLTPTIIDFFNMLEKGY